MTTLAESIEQKKERLRVQISQQAAGMLESIDRIFAMLRDTPDDAVGMDATAAQISNRAQLLRVLTAQFEELTSLPYDIDGHAVDDAP